MKTVISIKELRHQIRELKSENNMLALQKTEFENLWNDNKEWTQTVVDRFNVSNSENNKLREGLKSIREQLFDINNRETIITNSIDEVLKTK